MISKPDLYVILRMLEILWHRRPDGILKTKLQMSTGVNYNVYMKYHTLLTEKGLISVTNRSDGHEMVQITDKGAKLYTSLVLSIRDIMGIKD